MKLSLVVLCGFVPTREKRDLGYNSVDIIVRPAQPGDIPRMSELLAELFSIESDFSPNMEKQVHGLGALIADLADICRTHVFIYSFVYVSFEIIAGPPPSQPSK